MRRTMLWDTALGFLGFFSVLAVIQAIINLFQDSPAIWPGLVAGVLCFLTYLTWRAKRKDLS